MSKKQTVAAVLLVTSLFLAGCGEDPALTQYKKDFETFCVNLSTLDSAINKIDAQADTAEQELLGYIDQLNEEFATMAALDIPEDFDYLEELADQAAEYMSTAAVSYHDAYNSEYYEQNMGDYAYANYKRAYKRIQIMLIYLHGDTPTPQQLASE